MGENDLFFRLENHGDIFAQRPVVTIPDGHITGYWKAGRLRQHILDVLEWIEDHPDFTTPNIVL
jgi:hypothetical protein